MTGGMAGIAGTVLVLYAQFLRDAVPDAAGHSIIASVLGAPIAVMIGQIMVPDETRHPHQFARDRPSRSPKAPWTPSPRARPSAWRCCST